MNKQSRTSLMERKHNAPILTLGVLNAVHERSTVTQRNLADELGIALGLANAYLKRCVYKGFIKVQSAPARRYAYYLTPTGFAEKSRLTAQYLSDSLSFFRAARAQSADAFVVCGQNNWRRIVLAGASELCEIATLAAREHPVEIVAIVDASASSAEFAGHRVVAKLADVADIDAVLITDTMAPQRTYDTLVAELGADRVMTPPLLHVVATEQENS